MDIIDHVHWWVELGSYRLRVEEILGPRHDTRLKIYRFKLDLGIPGRDILLFRDRLSSRLHLLVYIERYGLDWIDDLI